MRPDLHSDLADTISAYEPTSPEEGYQRRVWAALATEGNLGRDDRPAHFTASALPLTPDGEAVCLVLHPSIRRWVQPGGHFEESDRSVAAAAGREMQEETGLSGTIEAAPLRLSRHAAPCGRADWHLDLQLLAVTSPAEPALSAESLDVAWFEVGMLPVGVAPGVLELVTAARRRLHG